MGSIEKITTILPATERIIVIGDLHGDIAMLCSCLYMANIINTNMEWVAEPANTIVVQIGDQLDSLSRDTSQEWERLDDIKLMQFTNKLDEIAKKKGGRFISLLGNHEMMNVFGEFTYVSPLSMEKSGGVQGRRHRFQPGGEYAKILAKRNSILKIGNILFCHAGLLPHHLQMVNLDLQSINDLNQKFLLGFPLDMQEITIHRQLFGEPSSMIWNRSYLEGLNNPNMKNALEYVLQNTQTISMIIGHNPVEHVTALYDNKLWITDVGLSRSFSSNNLELLEILHGHTFNVIQAVKK
jgi:hypothetical protein